mgnify:CR=1 FL=1
MRKKTELPSPDEALPGRDMPLNVSGKHFILDTPLVSPWPEGLELAMFGMGCFWGAEKLFWSKNGIHVTAVGYSAGNTKDPTYKDICYGDTHHAEVVKIVYNPSIIDTLHLLRVFWEGHNPTQGMRQGNDIGTQYRSIIITTNENQFDLAKSTKKKYLA